MTTKNDKNEFIHISIVKNSHKSRELINSVVKLNFGELILNSIDKDGTVLLDLKSIDMIPKNFKNPILLMAGKPEHFYETLAQKSIELSLQIY